MKKMSISLSWLSAKNIVTLGLLMAETSMKSGSESLKNSPVVKTLLDVATRLFELINRKANSLLTGKVEDLDIRRDRVLIGLRAYVNSMLYSLDDGLVAAATRIEAVLDKHGAGIDKLQLQEETIVLRKLLDDLKAPELAADITKVALAPRLVDLETAMAEFEEAYYHRSVDQASINEQQSITSQRRELEEAIRNFIAYANVMAITDPEWATLVKVLGPEVEKMKATIAKPEAKAPAEQ